MSNSYGAALEFLESRFNGALEVMEDDVTTGATNVLAISGDADRVSLTFANLGANPVFIGPRPNISATHGLRLGANGGMVSMNVEEDSLLASIGWYAISPAGASSLYVLIVRRSHISKE